jgi:hypothetical protein
MRSPPRSDIDCPVSGMCSQHAPLATRWKVAIPLPDVLTLQLPQKLEWKNTRALSLSKPNTSLSTSIVHI